MTATHAAILTSGLGRDYGATRALDALDLHVPSGALVGLLGPNGAGKTTTMLLLATLLGPSRGSAVILGHDSVRERAAIRRRLGLVFQEASVDGVLTVEENLLFAARLMGLDGATARSAVTETIDRAGLAARVKQPAKTLSTGWRRLVDLARALLHKPDLLILDEPTVGLDPEHRDRAWRLIEADRRARGTTVLFSTHYLLEAERVDQAVLLANGRVVAADRPAALKAAIGDEVVEIEGDEVDAVLPDVERLPGVRAKIRTDGGCRVGIAGARVDAGVLGALASRSLRVTVRPVTLEDVYFARTQAR